MDLNDDQAATLRKIFGPLAEEIDSILPDDEIPDEVCPDCGEPLDDEDFDFEDFEDDDWDGEDDWHTGVPLPSDGTYTAVVRVSVDSAPADGETVHPALAGFLQHSIEAAMNVFPFLDITNCDHPDPSQSFYEMRIRIQRP